MAVSGNPRMTYRTLATFALRSLAKESSPATSNTDGSEILVVVGRERFRMSAMRRTTFWKQSPQTRGSTRLEQLF
jgi:hypothetical protein